MFVSCALPLAVLGLVLAYGQFDALMATLTVLGLRMALRLLRSSGGPLDTLIGLGLVPLRELLTAYAWCRGLFCRRIEWRNRQYELAKDGSLKRRTPTSTTSWDES